MVVNEGHTNDLRFNYERKIVEIRSNIDKLHTLLKGERNSHENQLRTKETESEDRFTELRAAFDRKIAEKEKELESIGKWKSKEHKSQLKRG